MSLVTEDYIVSAEVGLCVELTGESTLSIHLVYSMLLLLGEKPCIPERVNFS